MSLLHQIALSCLSGIGPVIARNLLSYCGSASAIFETKSSHLSKIPGIGPGTIRQIKNHEAFKRAEEELDFIRKYQIQSLFITESNYPKRLKNCPDAPVMLYFKGNAELNTVKVISIVGTRNSTAYGKDLCRSLLAALEVYKPLIVSGLAYGIDYISHREALRNSIPTVGVIAHGMDRIYPAQHRQIAERMLNNGGLITEFMSGTIPDRENFPKRNRIIAGLSDVTIIVEAGIKGGALITAELANSYNRDVFAYPGRINDEFSAGCNHLIKTNKAHLISGIADLEYLLGWADEKPLKVGRQLALTVDLSDDEKVIANVIQDKGSVIFDDLAISTGFQQSKLTTCILEMEMKGLIITLPGKVYKMV